MGRRNDRNSEGGDLLLEAGVWAASALYNNIDTAEYKQVVLSLIFLKDISNHFEKRFDEDFAYDFNRLDRDVLAVDQIRTITCTFPYKLFTETFLGRIQIAQNARTPKSIATRGHDGCRI